MSNLRLEQLTCQVGLELLVSEVRHHVVVHSGDDSDQHVHEQRHSAAKTESTTYITTKTTFNPNCLLNA